MAIVSRESRRNYRRFVIDVFGTPVTTIVTSTPAVVRKWLACTLNIYGHRGDRLVVGFGVQWAPDTCRCQDNPAATLQLCVGRCCLIFQLIHAYKVPSMLRRFLTDPDVTFVGFWNHSDERKLYISDHEVFMDRPPIDLKDHLLKSNGQSLAYSSTEKIVREWFDVEVTFNYRISRSDWEQEKLSRKQVVQACVEARAAYRIGRDIDAWKISK